MQEGGGHCGLLAHSDMDGTLTPDTDRSLLALPGPVSDVSLAGRTLLRSSISEEQQVGRLSSPARAPPSRGCGWGGRTTGRGGTGSGGRT